MKYIHKICFATTIVIIVFHIFNLNYSDLTSDENTNHYLGILAMVLLATSFIFGFLEKNENN